MKFRKSLPTQKLGKKVGIISIKQVATLSGIVYGLLYSAIGKRHGKIEETREVSFGGEHYRKIRVYTDKKKCIPLSMTDLPYLL